MFTGIIQDTGKISGILSTQEGDVQLRIKSDKLPLDKLKLGDSISVNGVCLTATRIYEDGFLK